MHSDVCTRIGDHDLGISSGEKALKLLENTGIDETNVVYEARILQLLGILYYSISNYPKSVSVFQRLLNVLKKFDIDSIDSAFVREKIVDCLIKSHKPHLARPYLEDLLSEHKTFANLLKYGKILMALDEFDLAEQALKSADEGLNEADKEKFGVLATLALVQVKKQDFAKAQNSLERCVKVVKELGIDTCPEILWVYSQLGQIYFTEEKFQMALNVFKTFLLLSDELQIFDVEYGAVLVTLGKTYSKLGEKVESLKFLTAGKRILEGFKKENGLEANLAILEVYLKEGNILKTWEILQEIENVQYSPLVSALAENEMGNLLREFGHLEQSLQYYEAALIKYKALKGETSEETGKILFNIGSLMNQLGKYSAALEHLSQAQTIKLKFSLPESVDLANVYVEIGKSLFKLGKKAYGHELQEKGNRIIKKLT